MMNTMKKTISFLTILFVILVPVVFAFASGGGGAEGCKPGMLTGLLQKSFGMDCNKAELLFGLLQKTFNVVILIGLLYWLLAAQIKEFFSGRRAEIKKNLEESVEKKAEAEKKYREYSEKIDKASVEIDGICEMIKAQGVTEKQKIIEDAEKAAKKMKEDAHARIEQELKGASDQLKEQAVQLSVQMAEEILKRNITAQDHETMVKEYMDKVVIKH